MLIVNPNLNLLKFFPFSDPKSHFFFFKIFQRFYLDRKSFFLLLVLIRLSQKNRVSYFVFKCLLARLYKLDASIASTYFSDLERLRWKFSIFFLSTLRGSHNILLEFYLNKVDIFKFQVDMFYDRNRDFSKLISYHSFFLKIDILAFFILYIAAEALRTALYNTYIMTQVCFYEHGPNKFIRRSLIENLYLRPRNIVHHRSIRTFKPGRPRRPLKLHYFNQHWTSEHLKYRFINALFDYRFLLYYVDGAFTPSWKYDSYYSYCFVESSYNVSLHGFLRLLENRRFLNLMYWPYFRGFGEYLLAAEAGIILGTLKYEKFFHSRRNIFRRLRDFYWSVCEASPVEFFRFFYFYGHNIRQKFTSEIYFSNINHFLQIDLYHFNNINQFDGLEFENHRFNYVNIISIVINNYLDFFLSTFTVTMIRLKYWKRIKNWINFMRYLDYFFEYGFFEFWEVFGTLSNRFFLSLDYFFWRIYNPITELNFLDNRLDLMYLMIKIDIDTIVFSRYLTTALFVRRFFRNFHFTIYYRKRFSRVAGISMRCLVFSSVRTNLFFLLFKQFYIKVFKFSNLLGSYMFFINSLYKSCDLFSSVLKFRRNQIKMINSYIINFHAYNLYFKIIKKPVFYLSSNKSGKL